MADSEVIARQPVIPGHEQLTAHKSAKHAVLRSAIRASQRDGGSAAGLAHVATEPAKIVHHDCVAGAGVLEYLGQAGPVDEPLCDRQLRHQSDRRDRQPPRQRTDIRTVAPCAGVSGVRPCWSPAAMFELFRRQEGRQDRFRFGREADGSPAKPWAGMIWTDAAGLSHT